MAKWKTSNLMSVLIPVFVLALLVLGVTTFLLRQEKAMVSDNKDVVELKVGSIVPDFELVSLTGERKNFSDLKKKINVVNFWATWCGPCVEEMPSLNKLYSKFKNEGLAVFGVNMDEDPETALPPFLKKLPIDFPLYADTDGDLADKLSVGGLPYTVVIDDQMKVLFIELGERDWVSSADQEQFKTWLGGAK